MRRPPRCAFHRSQFYASVLLLSKKVLIRTALLPVPGGKGWRRPWIRQYQTVDFLSLGKRFKDFGNPIGIKVLQELNGPVVPLRGKGPSAITVPT